MSNHFSIYNFGFALGGVLLLFYVLCSKEAQIWLKPISLFVAPLQLGATAGARQAAVPRNAATVK